MQGLILERVRELLTNGQADRVLGWEEGEFFCDRTPAVFTADQLDRLKYDSFCGRQGISAPIVSRTKS